MLGRRSLQFAPIRLKEPTPDGRVLVILVSRPLEQCGARRNQREPHVKITASLPPCTRHFLSAVGGSSQCGALRRVSVELQFETYGGAMAASCRSSPQC